MATKAQLLGIMNTELADQQPILARQHRVQVTSMLDELYNAQSRGNVLAGLPLTSLQLANDTFLAFRNGAALQVPFSAIFADPLTLGTPNGLELDGQVLSLGLASATTTGALSFADFSIFNAKENAFVKNTAFNKNFGTVANTVTQGNDPRLSDARVPLAHTHVISDVTGLQAALNNKENAFAKNTGFNKNFGTVAGTVAQGNDSRFHAAATLGTANGLSLAGQVLSLGLASTSATGALSSTDWNTFNNKQNALTNPVTGTGASGQVAFWTGADTQSGDSGLVWDNTNKFLEVLGTNSSIIRARGNTLGAGFFVTEINSGSTAMAFGNDQVITGGQNNVIFSSVTLDFFLNGKRWSILSNGIFQSNGSQTIQTSTGNLTLATGGGNGNILLSPHGTGNVGIGTTAPAASAILDLTSTTGALLLPRMTTTQRDALTAVNGMLIYNTTTDTTEARQGGFWIDLSFVIA